MHQHLPGSRLPPLSLEMIKIRHGAGSHLTCPRPSEGLFSPWLDIGGDGKLPGSQEAAWWWLDVSRIPFVVAQLCVGLFLFLWGGGTSQRSAQKSLLAGTEDGIRCLRLNPGWHFRVNALPIMPSLQPRVGSISHSKLI